VTGRAVPLPGAAPGLSLTERVLQRAIELAGDGTATGVELGRAHLRQVAAELEVPSWAVAAALAEAQVAAGLPPAGPLSRLVGPVAVVGWRHVDADPDRTEELVTAWLETAYALRVRRLGDGTLIATRRPGLAGSVARAARNAGGGRELTGVHGEVRAAVVPRDDDEQAATSVVSVLVDIRARRRAAVGGGAAISGLGVAGAVLGAAVATPVLLVGVPLSLAGGAVVAAVHHRGVVRVVTEEVEVALDGVARRDRPVGPLRGLARTVSRGMRPPARAHHAASHRTTRGVQGGGG
jgi:hypothetical protein